MYSDSQAAIAYTKDPKFHCKTKHIDTRYKFAKDYDKRKDVDIRYISTHEMIAIRLPKRFPEKCFTNTDHRKDCVWAEMYLYIPVSM